MAARSEGAQQPLSSSTAAVTENPTKPKGISQRIRYSIEEEYEADWAELPVYPETDDQSESEEGRTDDEPKTVKDNQVVRESDLDGTAAKDGGAESLNLSNTTFEGIAGTALDNAMLESDKSRIEEQPRADQSLIKRMPGSPRELRRATARPSAPWPLEANQRSQAGAQGPETGESKKEVGPKLDHARGREPKAKQNMQPRARSYKLAPDDDDDVGDRTE